MTTPTDPRVRALALFRELWQQSEEELLEQALREAATREPPEVLAGLRRLLAKYDEHGDRLTEIRRMADREERRLAVRELCQGDDDLEAAFTACVAGPNPDDDRRPEAFQFQDPWPAGYERLEVLGRGGMGVVCRARQMSLNREVAVKLLLHGGIAGEEERARFFVEAQAAAAIQHPNIVTVYEVGSHAGLPYLVMELCDRCSLAQRLREPMPEREAAALIRTLAEALALAHAAKIVHRDLKPANVLFTPEGLAKIADFGLARLIEKPSGLTRTNAILGTPSYMAPEQARGEPVEPTADVYALGAILYECLTRRPPFLGTSPHETIQQVLHNEPVPPGRLQPGVPRDLDTICLRCLQKDPKNRYASAADLAADLRRYLDGDPIHARPAGPVERATKWAKRNPAGAVASVGSGILVLALLGAAYFAVSKAHAEGEKDKADKRAAEAGEEKAKADGRAARAEASAERAEKNRLQREREFEQTQAREKADRDHLALVADGDNFRAGGDWLNALERYRRAVANARPDALSLRVKCLPGLLLHASRNETAAEFASLFGEAERLGGADLAQLNLMQADFLLSGNQPDLARPFVHRALALRRLPPEDAAYARAILSKSTTEALTHLRTALAINPRHPRAHHALMATLAIRGEFAEARAHAEKFRLLFPDDPLPDVLEAGMRIGEGRYAEALTAIDLARPALGDERHKAVRQYLGRLAVLHRAAVGQGDPNPAAGMLHIARNWGHVFGGRSDDVAFGFNVPVMVWMDARLAQVYTASWRYIELLAAMPIKAFRSGAADRAIASFSPMCEDSPEPIYLVLLAWAKLYKASVMSSAGKDDLPLWVEAADLFDQAATAPTIAPGLSVRFSARLMSLDTDNHIVRRAQARPADVPDVARFAERLSRNTFATLRDRRAFPKEWATVMNPRGLASYSPHVSLTLLGGWMAEEPTNPVPARLSVRVMLSRRAPFEALDQADEMLKRFPGDGQLVAMREEATRAIRERADKIGLPRKEPSPDPTKPKKADLPR